MFPVFFLNWKIRFLQNYNTCKISYVIENFVKLILGNEHDLFCKWDKPFFSFCVERLLFSEYINMKFISAYVTKFMSHFHNTRNYVTEKNWTLPERCLKIFPSLRYCPRQGVRAYFSIKICQYFLVWTRVMINPKNGKMARSRNRNIKKLKN